MEPRPRLECPQPPPLCVEATPESVWGVQITFPLVHGGHQHQRPQARQTGWIFSDLASGQLCAPSLLEPHSALMKTGSL